MLGKMFLFMFHVKGEKIVTVMITIESFIITQKLVNYLGHLTVIGANIKKEKASM